MRNETYPAPELWTGHGVLLSSLASEEDGGLDRVQFGQDGQVFECLALPGLQLPSIEGDSLACMTLRFLQEMPHSQPVLVGCEREPAHNGLAHLPDEICPVENSVSAIKCLVEQIQTLPLRNFVARVFVRRDVHSHFWRMPASARHHHAFPGGLAAHSLEVAEDIAAQVGLCALERDLGIAGALLHDIGKVWSYTDNMFLNEAGLAMGHELLGLARLEPELAELEAHWADGAYVLRTLLSGNSRVRENGSLACSMLVRIRACDQRSCERERAQSGHQGKHSRRAWTPRAWTAPAVEDPFAWT